MPLNEADRMTIIAALRAAAEAIDRIVADATKIKAELYKIMDDIRD